MDVLGSPNSFTQSFPIKARVTNTSPCPSERSLSGKHAPVLQDPSSATLSRFVQGSSFFRNILMNIKSPHIQQTYTGGNLQSIHLYISGMWEKTRVPIQKPYIVGMPKQITPDIRIQPGHWSCVAITALAEQLKPLPFLHLPWKC